ncbi:MAG: diacylglycerol kinase family protein [Gloeobacterales cyanobacterium]
MPTNIKASPKIPARRSWQVAHTLQISFQYAWAGVLYATATQRNFRVHLGVGALAIALGITLGITPLEFAVVGIMIALVLTMELLNTAVEAMVDLTIGEQYHDLAKIAKDCAAGAVLISSIGAMFVAGWILLPPLVHYIYIGHP